MNKSRIVRFLCCIALAVGFSTAAFGQATRTWVSGVGDDANPCSRTAPCKTFAGAISKTAEGGEIDALDPGGFGAVTITKAMTIDGTHGSGFGSILNSGVSGVVVNTVNGTHAADAVVILRSLYIQGASQSPAAAGIHGINYIKAQRLMVYDCHIENQGTTGINMGVAATGTLFVHETDFSNVNTAINATSSVGGQVAIVQASNITVQGNTNGVNLAANSFGFVTDSFFARNVLGGVGNAIQVANGATANLTHCHFFSNATAINAIVGSTVRVNECELFDNSVGFGGNAASFQSGGNNKLAGNGASVTPTGPAITTQ
jgi:hypothetical protein